MLPSPVVSTWFAEVVAEARADGSAFLVIGLALAILVRRSAARAGRSHARVRGTAVLLGLHLASLPLVGFLAAAGSDAHGAVRLVSLAFAATAAVNVCVALLFDGLLRWLHVPLPRIATDVITGAGYVVAALFLLSAAGVNLSGIIATSAVLTAVIGFSMQDTLGNLMGGLALQLEDSLHPGDWLEVEGKVGRVQEIRWRQTSIETRAWETIVVPNSVLAKNTFVLLGRRAGQPTQLRRSIEFQVDYRTPATEVLRACADALEGGVPGVARHPAPHGVFLDMRESYNTYALRYWLVDQERGDRVHSEVRTRLSFALRRAGVALTMPARAVFLTQDSEERQERKGRRRRAERAAALAGIELFDHLEEDEIDELAAQLRFAPYAAGETLTREGGDDSDLFLIASGRIGVRVGAGAGERQVAELGAGAFFGEMSLMTGAPRSASTVALEDTVCYRLPPSAVEALLERRPALAEPLAETLARRQAELDTARQDLHQTRRPTTEAEHHQLLDRIRDFFRL